MTPTFHFLDAADVLEAIRFDALSPGPQPLTVARIAREICRDPSIVCTAINYFVERGKITKEQVAA
jgi:predicted transcriptional regulator